MHLPCVNPICPNTLGRNSSTTSLCFGCRAALTRDLIPTCGYIPNRALTDLGKGLLTTLKPTSQDLTAALRMVRGPRHPTGDWQLRPTYSAPVVHSHSPKAPLSRRMPELLVGRRANPTVGSLLASYIHFVLAKHVIGLSPQPSYYLAGITYYKRKDTQRPVGVRREYRGKVVRNSYRLNYNEFVSIGRLVVKAAGLLGVDRSYDAGITTSYLKGVEAGLYHPPVIVHPHSQQTLASGDHPLDHVIDLNCQHAPWYRRQIRRASGLMAKTRKWPALLNRSHEEVQRDLKVARDAKAAVFKISTTTETPSTDWLFS